MKNNYVTNKLSKDDTNDITNVHLAGFPNSFLTKLGYGAVWRYYSWLLSGPHDTIPIGAFTGGKLVGFCIGGVFQDAMSGYLRNNQGFLFWRVLSRPWLIFNPFFRRRLRTGFNAIWNRQRREKSSGKPKPIIKPFRILSIVVHPKHRGKGVGKLILNDIENKAWEADIQILGLTVEINNVHAIRLYHDLGWEEVLDEKGKWAGRMSKRITA